MTTPLRRAIPEWTTAGLALLAATLATIVALVPFETVMAFVLIATGVYCGARRPDWGLALIALSVPVQRTLLVGFGDTSLTITKVVLWSTLSGWILGTARRRSRVEVDVIVATTAILVGVLAWSGRNAEDGGLWIGETYRWLAMIPVGMFALTSYRAGWSPLPFLLGTAFGTIACFASAAWQVIAEIGPPSFQSRGLMRATGPFGHPNQLAIYFELTTPLMLALVLASISRKQSRVFAIQTGHLTLAWAIAAVAGAGGLLLSQSRGGGVGLLVGLGVTIALLASLARRHVVIAAVLGLAGLLIGLTWFVLFAGNGNLSSSARETQVNAANFAVEERLAHWVAGVEMAERRPLLGVGAGNYDLNFRDSTETWRFRIGRGHAHNTYVQMLAQAGVAGFTSYLLLLGAVVLTLAAAVRRCRSSVHLALAIGATGVTAAIMVHAVFEYVHVLSLNLQMAILWGLAASIATGVPGMWSAPERSRAINDIKMNVLSND